MSKSGGNKFKSNGMTRSCLTRWHFQINCYSIFLEFFCTVFENVLEMFESSKVERRQKAAREMELEVLKEEGLGKVRIS